MSCTARYASQNKSARDRGIRWTHNSPRLPVNSKEAGYPAIVASIPLIRSVQRAERFDFRGWSRDDQLIGAGNRRFGPFVGEVFTATIDPYNGDPVLLSQIGLFECAAGRYVRGTGARDGETVVEFDEVGHGAGHPVGDALAHRLVGVPANDALRAT